MFLSCFCHVFLQAILSPAKQDAQPSDSGGHCSALTVGQGTLTTHYSKSLDALLLLTALKKQSQSFKYLQQSYQQGVAESQSYASFPYLLAYKRYCYCKFYLLQQVLHVVPIYAVFYNMFPKKTKNPVWKAPPRV